MASYSWGGVANGNIALSLLRLALGVYLRADAAIALLAMAAAFRARFGIDLRVTEGYRPLGAPGDYKAGRSNTQWFYWERKQADPSAPSAAYPGGSIHGWALAVDINLNGMTRDMIEWLHAEGRAYGFNWETTGRPSNEPWHLDFNLTVTASLDATTFDNTDEPTRKRDQMFIAQSAATGHQALIGELSGRHFNDPTEFSFNANKAGLQTVIVPTDDVVATLVNEANDRGRALLAEFHQYLLEPRLEFTAPDGSAVSTVDMIGRIYNEVGDASEIQTNVRKITYKVGAENQQIPGE